MQVFVYVIESSSRSEGNSVRDIKHKQYRACELSSYRLQKEKRNKKTKITQQQFNNALVVE